MKPLYKHIVLAIFLALFGIGSCFYLRFNESIDPIFSFFLMWLGFAACALFTSKIIINNFFLPESINIPILNPTKEQVNFLVEKIGEKKFKKTKIVGSVLFVTLFISLFSISYLIVDWYEDYELENHGKIITVKIDNQSKNMKGFPITKIKYENVEKEFYLNHYQIGETRKLIYSERFPKVARWVDVISPID